MKKVMFALCLVFGGFAVVSAQDSTSTSPKNENQSQYPQDASQDQERERIQSTELPDGVKRSLEGQEYRGWLVNGAYKAKGISNSSTASDQSSSSENSATKSDSSSTDVNREGTTNAVGAQGEEVFIVELKNGAQTKTVSFDKDGKKIEGMEEGQDQNDNDINTSNDQKEQSDPNEQNDPNEQAAPKGHTAPKDHTAPNNHHHDQKGKAVPHDKTKSTNPKVKDDQK